MEEKIALITDSMCDLPRNIITKFGIKVLSPRIIYPDKEYLDRVDIEPQDVYQKMPEEIPTTSMPSLQEIKNLFTQLEKEGFTHALALHISGALSGTAQAVKMISRDFQNLQIKVIDTKTLSMGTGWIVLDAARNIARGFSFNNVVESVQEMQSKVNVYYILETLEYLRRGGRIGNVAAMLGEFLHLKPVISVNKEGAYFVYCKTKGRKKSIERLVKIVENAVKEKEINLALMHGGARQEFEALLERFKKLPNIKELLGSDISPALGVHTGPGLLGIAFYEA